jgi:hypothetical protein
VDRFITDIEAELVWDNEMSTKCTRLWRYGIDGNSSLMLVHLAVSPIAVLSFCLGREMETASEAICDACIHETGKCRQFDPGI